nr:type II toxin-antitoxin system RelE/ParE family toxin [Sulfurimonas sp. SAG-AH-194-L11]
MIEEMEDVSTKFYKKLSNCDDIIEIRAQIGKNNFRLLGFENKGTLVILTNGFKKKDQKILKSEITLVEKRKKEYLSRGD